MKEYGLSETTTLEDHLRQLDRKLDVLASGLTQMLAFGLLDSPRYEQPARCGWCGEPPWDGESLAEVLVGRQIDAERNLIAVRTVELCPRCLTIANAHAEAAEMNGNRWQLRFPYARGKFGQTVLCPDPALNVAAYVYETDPTRAAPERGRLVPFSETHASGGRDHHNHPDSEVRSGGQAQGLRSRRVAEKGPGATGGP
jgi:hypothetical protein